LYAFTCGVLRSVPAAFSLLCSSLRRDAQVAGDEIAAAPLSLLTAARRAPLLPSAHAARAGYLCAISCLSGRALCRLPMAPLPCRRRACALGARNLPSSEGAATRGRQAKRRYYIALCLDAGARWAEHSRLVSWRGWVETVQKDGRVWTLSGGRTFVS